MSGYTASADMVATWEFHNAPLEIINEVDSPPQYTYNVKQHMIILEENARLVIYCQKGRRICEVSKNRLTLLLSGNVAVNCKLIPL